MPYILLLQNMSLTKNLLVSYFLDVKERRIKPWTIDIGISPNKPVKVEYKMWLYFYMIFVIRKVFDLMKPNYLFGSIITYHYYSYF